MEVEVTSARIDHRDGVVIAVEGELDIGTVKQLGDPVRQALARGGDLVLDLSACSFIDSTALAFLLRTHAALSEDGKAMGVVAGRGEVRRLLYLTAIDRSVPVFGTRGDAIELLGANGSKPTAALRSHLSYQSPGRPSA